MSRNFVFFAMALLFAASSSTLAESLSGSIVYTHASSSTANRDIFIMNGDGSGPTSLTGTSYDNYGATFSPDGKTIAFISNRPADGQPPSDGQTNSPYMIWIMNRDGTNPRVIPNSQCTRYTDPGGGRALSWSPDSSRVAFITDTNNRIWHTGIATINLERV